MGLFGFGKNKNDDAKPDIAEKPAADDAAEDEEFAAPGWDAITEVFTKLYPGQDNPLHYGTLVKWQLGGNDPLDGVSIYESDGYYHFVTYGFSDLYEKERDDPERSGFGIELTMKLKKGNADDEGEIKCVVGNLQGLARYVFKSGKVFQPNEYIYTGQTNGIDLNHASKLTGFIMTLDEIGEIDTPNGKVMFVQLVGATERELQSVLNKEKTVPEILALLPGTVTDLARGDTI
ncbi:MAG: suppressor of fused domain protein [Clostridiales bacterium]|nr:suppressor of fused domain protein [Clostridiales bacterium]